MDSAFANKENLTANTNGTSDAENSRASVILNCEDTNDSVAVSEAPSEALSEAPSEPVSEAPSETISESDTQDIPGTATSTHPTDSTDEPAQKKVKVDEQYVKCGNVYSGNTCMWSEVACILYYHLNVGCDGLHTIKPPK